MADDLNQARDALLRRKLATRGAWSYLLTLPHTDIAGVLLDMLTDVEAGMIPSVAPADMDAEGVAQPKTIAKSLAPVAAPARGDPDDEGVGDGEDEVVLVPPSPAEQKHSARLGDIVQEVLRESRRGMRSTEIAVAVRARIPDVEEHDVQQWLSREYRKKRALSRRGAKGQYRYFLRDVPSRQVEKPANDSRLTQTDSPLYAGVIAHLGKGPADLAQITQAYAGVDSGKPRQDVRNALYYLRDRRGVVRQREDGLWELAAAP